MEGVRAVIPTKEIGAQRTISKEESPAERLMLNGALERIRPHRGDSLPAADKLAVLGMTTKRQEVFFYLIMAGWKKKNKILGAKSD